MAIPVGAHVIVLSHGPREIKSIRSIAGKLTAYGSSLLINRPRKNALHPKLSKFADKQRKGEVMTNHTPGPWTIHDYEVWTSKGPGHGLVCHCAPYCPPLLNSEQGREFTANAHLIAAAPELLEALHDINILMDALNISNIGLIAASAHQIVRAAIAKAEGK